MQLNLEKLEEFRADVFMMHCQELFVGGGQREFSYRTFYNKETGEFDEPIVTDSINDTAVTTTSVFDADAMVAIAQRLSEDENLIYVWGHSHVNMGTTPSFQDLTTIREDNLELSVISNNKGEIRLLYKEGEDIYEITKNSGDSTVSKRTTFKQQRTKRGKRFSNHAGYRNKQSEPDDDGYLYGQYFDNHWY